MKKKICVVFGTRPEALKLAPVIRRISEKSDLFDLVICVTGQHRQMLDQVLELFAIAPQYDLGIMKPGQDLFEITAGTMLGIREVLGRENPDLVLVQGDTTTTFASALSAFYLGIPSGHIEAGLRSYDNRLPFPEEVNRRLTSHLARWHFAPTRAAAENLLGEGIEASRIWITGNTIIDTLLMTVERISGKGIHDSWNRYFTGSLGFGPASRKVILVTGHRRESFGEGFRNICEALRAISLRHPEVEIVYPLHLNPNVQGPVKKSLAGRDNIHIIDPLEYEPFVFLMARAFLILTDSGGIQEEAPSLGKPVLVMRDVTERPEAVEAGTSRLVGTDAGRIADETERLLTDEQAYLAMSRKHNPYGDGKASERIVEILVEQLSESA